MENLYKSLQTRSLAQVFICITLFIMSLACGCIQAEKYEDTDQEMTIACTIPPQEEFIRAIAGNESVTVLVMVPQGASPHTFEPAPSQIARLESADLYLALGSGIEFEDRWISGIMAQYPDLPIINTSQTIVLKSPTDHHHEEEILADNENLETEENYEHSDPHIWLSPKNTALIVHETTDGMMMRWPALNDTFAHNRDVYTQKLTELDMNISELLQDLPSRTILVYHPAFGYFTQDYNLTQLAVEENGKEPSAQKLAEIIRNAKKENIKLIFAEPESSTREAETLARELNGTMVLISPLAGNYLENMQNIAEKIAGS